MITKKNKGERLLEIDNGHTPSGGPPPFLDGTGRYVGYFENRHGEQWLFLGDPASGEAVLRGGDVGWATEHKISLTNPCPSLILDEPEKLWIITCFTAMCQVPFDTALAHYNRTARELTARAERRPDENG